MVFIINNYWKCFSHSQVEKVTIGLRLFQHLMAECQSKLLISEDSTQTKCAFENELQCSLENETDANKSSFNLIIYK